MNRLLVPVAVLLLLSTPAMAQVGVGQCEEPNVLVILDKSGSMDDDGKWGQAKRAIRRLTDDFQDRIRFGLMVFPWGGNCDVDLNDGALRAPVARMNAGLIQNQLDQFGPNGRTPLGLAVRRGRQYLQDLNDVVRRNYLVVVTDGIEKCGGDPDDEARDAFDAGYPVFVIGFGNGVDGRQLNRMAERGGTGRAYQADNEADLIQALDEIARRAGEEICDGRDNDCDQLVDEGIAEVPCQTPCGQGRQICADGQLSSCFGGNIPEETCDAVDNDCDMEIDEVFGVPCTTERGNPGSDQCVNGAPTGVCVPVNPEPEEVCDGVDNDMDGLVDEDTDEVCQVGCHDGRRLCVEGNLIRCTALPVEPEDVRCDGEDDDCDGIVDEAADCGSGVCNGGVCLEPCQFNECPDRYTCLADDFCHPNPCEPACPDGHECVLEQCVQPCVVDRDCDDGTICSADQLCVPGSRAPTGGASGGGTGNPGANPGGGTTGGGTGVPGGGGGVFVGTDGGVGSSEADADSETSGCNCDAGGGSPAGALGLLLLLVGSGRRRR
jgi:MYXO-CTERM domain-containing protein